jgi:hypothetical protein
MTGCHSAAHDRSRTRQFRVLDTCAGFVFDYMFMYVLTTCEDAVGAAAGLARQSGVHALEELARHVHAAVAAAHLASGDHLQPRHHLVVFDTTAHQHSTAQHSTAQHSERSVKQRGGSKEQQRAIGAGRGGSTEINGGS